MPAVLLVCLAALSAALHTLLGSNMGFIVSCPLQGPGANSLSGFHALNLPYQRDAQLLNAGDLMRDIGLAQVAHLQGFLESTDSLVVYTGRKGDGGLNNFPLQAGECYFVKMLASVDYTVGGSSDPQVSLALNAAGTGNRSGLNFVGLPYHAIARTAGELMQDIGLASVANVQRFVSKTDTLQVHTGRKGSPSPDFPLNACECYFIKMNSTVSYIPSHY
jgi:hypothetical protein